MTDIPEDVMKLARHLYGVTRRNLERASIGIIARAISADRAAQAERIRRLEDVLDGIYIYANDTLSGRVDGPDDRAWQRSAVVEIRNRARKFARAALGGNADA